MSHEDQNEDTDFIDWLKEEDAVWITAARGNGYLSVEDVWRRAGTPPFVLARLAEADVFTALRLDRREALWQAKAINAEFPLPLFAMDMEGEGRVEPKAHLPNMSLAEEMIEDYVSLSLSLRAHPLALLRPILTPETQF